MTPNHRGKGNDPETADHVLSSLDESTLPELMNYPPPQLPTEIDGIPINPKLREGFNKTDNDFRSEEEMAEWWNIPFIVTRTLGENEWGDDWKPEAKADFLKRNPEGTVYTVRRLDGGAWDRSTWHGDSATLDDAVSIAKLLQDEPLIPTDWPEPDAVDDFTDGPGAWWWSVLSEADRTGLTEQTRTYRDGTEPTPKTIWEFWKAKCRGQLKQK